jgi:hypothetical protein
MWSGEILAHGSCAVWRGSEEREWLLGFMEGDDCVGRVEVVFEEGRRKGGFTEGDDCVGRAEVVFAGEEKKKKRKGENMWWDSVGYTYFVERFEEMVVVFVVYS